MPMKIGRSTREYEAWLAKRTTLVPADLEQKHQLMASAAFPFLRATYYRWAQIWPEVCADLAAAPQVLAVGDLHVENFGTWRDIEGRLVWGVNDFDEVAVLPYTNDLVRLATSVELAITAAQLNLPLGVACTAIVDGYAAGLQAGGKPFVLSEQHAWLGELALHALRDPEHFWQHMATLPPAPQPLPESAREAIEFHLPGEAEPYKLFHRVAGLGSLGHQRWVALRLWSGGNVVREVKALVPSAAGWASDHRGTREILYQALLTRAVRTPDPSVHLRGPWLVRRLAPDCIRVELAGLPDGRDEPRLLHAMGWETANIHLGTPEVVAALQKDLIHRPAGWLEIAAKAMARAIDEDWHAWRKELKASR
ncbi:MAG: hypothetical protein NVS4B8_06190 [Herpetosiphon sp.]